MAIGLYTTITASIAAYNVANSYSNQCVTEKTFSDRSWEALSHHPILAGLSAYNFLSLTPLAATPIPLIAGIATWAAL